MLRKNSLGWLMLGFMLWAAACSGLQSSGAAPQELLSSTTEIQTEAAATIIAATRPVGTTPLPTETPMTSIASPRVERGTFLPTETSTPPNKVETEGEIPDIREVDPGPTEEQLRLLASLEDYGPAPELHNDVWLNSQPLKLADLRGKVVMVEFWTFG